MTIAIKWFPPSWLQFKINGSIIYIEPAYLRTYFISLSFSKFLFFSLPFGGIAPIVYWY